MRSSNIVVLIIAIVLGGIAAFLARNLLVGRTQATGPHFGTLVSASREVPFGTVLSDDNVQEIPWGAKTLPRGAFATKADLFKDGRRIALAAIQSEEPILNSKITGPGQRASLSTLLDKEKRAITIRVDDVRGVAGFILPNDRVDVVLIRQDSEAGSRRDISDLLLQDVKVIGVDQIVSEQKDKPAVAKAVTLEVTPYEAQRISLATSVGHLSLILRKAGDSEVVPNRQITQSDLIKGDLPLPPVVEASATPAPIGIMPTAVDTGATVTIVRDLKNQDYKVHRESR
jgi:pilus assembly protein CpaB